MELSVVLVQTEPQMEWSLITVVLQRLLVPLTVYIFQILQAKRQLRLLLTSDLDGILVLILLQGQLIQH